MHVCTMYLHMLHAVQWWVAGMQANMWEEGEWQTVVMVINPQRRGNTRPKEVLLPKDIWLMKIDAMSALTDYP